MTHELNPKEKINLDTFSKSKTVEEIYNTDGFSKLEEEIIERYFQPGKVLDLGCGTGRTTKAFSNKNFEVVGIDYSEAMITFARSKHPDLDFRVMNACDMDFNDESFDNILFSFNGMDSIYPVNKRHDCLKQIYRILKRGGTFAYSSHNALGFPFNRTTWSLFIKNLLSLRVFTHYRKDFEATGALIQYYGSPWREISQLNAVGFDVLDVMGKKFANKHKIIQYLGNGSLSYVAQKKGIG